MLINLISRGVTAYGKTTSRYPDPILGIDSYHHCLPGIMLIKKIHGYFPAGSHLHHGQIAGYGDAFHVDFIATGELYGSGVITGTEAFQ